MFKQPNFFAWSGLIGLACLANAALAAEAERPNILWITAEDFSPHLGCYGDGYARTPHLDRFAKQSVRYTHAFATAPVCSPARSTLITGCYATSLGTQRLRSEFPLPEFAVGYARSFREAGYFTSNNVKTDYNMSEEQRFIRSNWVRNSSEAHWRQRASGQPFFSVFNLMTTHQSRANVWSWEEFEAEVGSRLSREERHDPSKVPLPPYYPDTPLARRTMARYYDCGTVMDKEVGELLRQLEQDGLADDTIVFFYGDHGMGMPRGKRLLHDSGMRVPLIIRFPEKWRHLAPVDPGKTVDRLVSFVDFAPTVLNLAGLEIPEYMQGKAFLGDQVPAPRPYVFGARDRVDEVYELSRSVRDHRYLLIENYMPHLSWMPPERYSDNAEMRREMRRLAAEEKLNAAQLTYAAASKPVVEFYDTETDPHQIRNLAGRAEHRERIRRMSVALGQWQAETRDLGCLTEPMMWRRLKRYPTPWHYGLAEAAGELSRGWAAAQTVLRPDHLDATVELLADDLDAVRYWGTVGLHAHYLDSPKAVTMLRKSLSDTAPSVQVEAAAAILQRKNDSEAMKVLIAALEHPRVEVRLHAMRSLELLGQKARAAEGAIRSLREEASRKEGEHPCWMFVRFSAEAALDHLKRSQG